MAQHIHIHVPAIRAGKTVAMRDGSSEYGVRYRVAVGRAGSMQVKEKFFPTAAALEAGAKKLEESDGFIEFLAWLRPSTGDASYNELLAKRDALVRKMEALEDQGRTVPDSMREDLKKLHKEMAAAQKGK
jgi:hypothetical protein